MEYKMRPKTAETPNPFTASATKPQAVKQLSYKDYTVKTVKSKKHAPLSDLKTTGTSMRPSTAQTESTYQFKLKVQQKVNNFISQQERGMIDEDDSLLQDSQASRARDEKQLILEEQRARRRRDAELKKQSAEAAARKKKEMLEALHNKTRANLAKTQKVKSSASLKEKSRERIMKKKTAEMVERHRPTEPGVATQLQDLRSWIQEQLVQEKLNETVENESENTAHNVQKAKAKPVKEIPGNNLLSQEEEVKLGARQNRYGVFPTGQSEFDQVVEIQRAKVEKPAQRPPMTKEEKERGMQQMKEMIIALAQRTGSLVKETSPAKSDDSCDKVPVRDKRPIVNQKADKQGRPALPGVTDTKTMQHQIDQSVKEKEAKAAVVIQKWLRGHWGRREFSRQVFKRQDEIDVEYGRFDYQYKQAQKYNINRYLMDKQKLRKQAGLDSISEEIVTSSGSAPIVSSGSTKFQTFMSSNHSSEYDPLSLINIFVQRNKQLPVAAKPQAKQKQQKPEDEIAESIYSEKFDDQISEDIPQVSSSLSAKKKVIESDSIVDEVASAKLSKSDSILDEAAPAQDDSKSESEILEDSIIRNEYEQDNGKLSNAEKSLEARNRSRFGVASGLAQMSMSQQQNHLKQMEHRESSEIKHKNIMAELLAEMKSYEASAITANMMDRMDKIVISSLAQKDQVIMAQSLAELQREIRHKEEINRIREEQIRLMTQLMMMGGGFQQTEQQRAQMVQSIAQMAQLQQKPALSHQEFYQQRERVSYLQEYDNSKRNLPVPAPVPIPAPISTLEPVQAPVAAPVQIAREVAPAPQVQTKRKDSAESIEDEIGSVLESEDSIKEDLIQESIAESFVSMSHSSSQFEDFKRRQYKLHSDNKLSLDKLYIEIEQAIQRERDTKETRLSRQLRNKIISPRTYQRQRSDVDHWSNAQKQEAREIHHKLSAKEHKASPRNHTKHVYVQPLVHDSGDSDAVKQALNQAHLLEQGLIGKTADQKYIQRKREAAEKLMLEKEKAIAEQLNAKMALFEKEQADVTLQKALQLNVEEEAQRRFEALKKQLEESAGVESARSAISQSQNSSKVKKNVKFAAEQAIEESQEIEESIKESLVDSYSQSFKSDSKSKSLPKTPVKEVAKQEKIEESIQEQIVDDYSEGFEQSSDRALSSKPKVQETDHEESKPQQMDLIKEESSQETVVQSVPSEDVSVLNSGSVEWKIVVAPVSHRDDTYSQDDFDESAAQESINDRIDDELESNPDEVLESVDQADLLAQELLDLIVQEYLSDNTYTVSRERNLVDEELFKDKFPYTLDVVQPQQVIRPPQPMVIQIQSKPSGATKPAGKQRTQKDIQDEAFMQKHLQEQAQLAKQNEENKEFLLFLVKRVDIAELIRNLDTPIQQNPLQVLAQIQAYDDEEPPQIEEQEQQQILSQTFFNKIDQEYFSVKRLSSQDVTQASDEKIQNVHHYALFEAFNEALDLQRPYKDKGGPMPWSKNTRVVRQVTSVTQAKLILDQALNKVLEWATTDAGSKYAPLPPVPTQTQDEFGDEIVQPPLQQGEEERRNQHRQEKLGQLMTQDINETDHIWADYEIEDTQARFDLADMILADLAAEIAELLL